MNSRTGDDVSEERKLGNTSVLDLDVTKTVETVLVGIVKESERIEKSKWGLNSNLSLESSEGSGSLGYLGRSEGGGGAEAARVAAMISFMLIVFKSRL